MFKILFTSAVLILLAACGGGGGGSSPVKTVPFTTFSAITSGQPVQASGISQTASATTVSGTVTSTTLSSVDLANSSATLTYGAIPTMSAISFSAPASSVSYSGSSVQCVAHSGVCGGANTNSQAVAINPLDPPAPTLAWNYQSFGYWLVTSSGTDAKAGVISYGSPTPVMGLPIAGTATYTGLSSGAYVDPNGAVFVYAAQMQSNVDFGARTIGFSTSSTTVSPMNVVANTAAPELDVTGTLAYSAGSNQFSGPISATGRGGPPSVKTLAGSATGQFYGPTAQEIGGVLSLKDTAGPQTMLGGFGGKR